MKTVIMILPYASYIPEIREDTIVVGVDKGALDAIKQGIRLDYAIGDFDSISKSDLELIKKAVAKVVILPAEKDETDTEYAINYFGDANKIYIYGGIAGRRVEHFYANINLCLRHNNIVFIDKRSQISAIPNVLEIRNSDYYFYTFFAEENSIISLKGFKYELNNYKFKYADNLCISNELASEIATIIFSGKGVMIQTKDDHDEEF